MSLFEGFKHFFDNLRTLKMLNDKSYNNIIVLSSLALN